MKNVRSNNYKRIYDKSWNFVDGSMKEYVHGLHPYPAMMMPMIARTILNSYKINKSSKLLDPYVGSGTTIVESQIYGLKEAVGVDLNPLAILISWAKVTSYNLNRLKRTIRSFESFLLSDTNENIPKFSIMQHWFKEKNIDELGRIKEFISKYREEELLFLKVCFSEVVRDVSLTRNGEFKLYRMSNNSIEKYNPNAIEKFKEVMNRNFDYIEKFASINHNTDIDLIKDNVIDFLSNDKYNEYFDVVITSPPCGDSHTTVAYGQFSRLSNEWLSIDDAGSIDKQLMGGKKSNNFINYNIPELDNALSRIIKYDKDNNGDRYKSVISFYNDYFRSVNAVANSVKKGGLVVYVVGNRRVRNVELPTDVITYKMFERFGFKHDKTIVRDILNKRMPSKASPSNRVGGQIPTMTHEYIVIMHKKN